MSSKAIVWFRTDLRLHDNPALTHALKNFDQILPIYIYAEDDLDESICGGATKWWLHNSLIHLTENLKEKGLNLFCFRSKTVKEKIDELISKKNINAVFWNRTYEPDVIARDSKLKDSFKTNGIEARSFHAYTLEEPFKIQNKTGNPYQVFTPFWKTLQKHEIKKPIKSISKTEGKLIKHAKTNIDDLYLLSKHSWHEKLHKHNEPGEMNALKIFKAFKKNSILDYKEKRDFPKLDASSRLSAHLHFGEISPKFIYHELLDNKEAEPFLRQLGWRDFANHLLFHFPKTTKNALKKEFDSFPWSKDRSFFNAWKRGETGYPIVDAGIRELWETGIMHNRVRMIAGSLLVKQLLQPWQLGANWFWDTLVDADLANNTMGWQWVAGSGADAAPYFRIFNPVLQSQKFDKEATYIKKYLPELKDVPAKIIHEPFNFEGSELKKHGIVLGKDYPKPVVDLRVGRDKALEAYEVVKKSK